MTCFAAFIRKIGLAGAAAALAVLSFVVAAQAGGRAAPQSYVIDGQRYFAYEWARPGYIGVHVGVSNPGTETGNSVLTQQLGDVPPLYGFQEAAEIYLSEKFGRCWLTGHRYVWLGEIRFSFQCR